MFLACFKISESFSLPVSSQIQKLIRAFLANFGHKMVMMFQLCQVMVMISFSSSITLLASQLHPGEEHIPHELTFLKNKTPPVEALTQIGKTVNEDGQLSLKFVDRCQSGSVVETEPTSAGNNSTIGCNCSITDDNYCHINYFTFLCFSLLNIS
ncbi:hypothetical protein NC653_027484 [Populus alba x Populus x berolinensis]|uniref:Uncharacterized protein n=1 Tax=Populus alba x Populus x berolinensis TaxID=444605 RepID=A0AAD6Q547_9ROSI|nr:hypothetical protein NC653_027484 [Populus alba x Populus x berolinensis]